MTPFVSHCPKCRVIVHGPTSYTLQACEMHRPPLSTPGVLRTTDEDGATVYVKEVTLKTGDIET